MPSVVVVGASRGIGREFVRAYATNGWEVLATVREEADEADLTTIPGVNTMIADVTDEGSLKKASPRLPERVDLIVVNAGVGSREGLAGIDPADWKRVMTINALGPLLVARTLGGSLHDGGSFVALSSLMGSIGDNGGGGSYSYRMSKAALNMGLQNLAIEWRARRIAVAALHPGWVKTDMGGAGAPVEIADSVAGLRRVIAGLTPSESARFVDYRGQAIAW